MKWAIVIVLGWLLVLAGFWTGVVFMILRLAGATEWSWWAVTCPFWAILVGGVPATGSAIFLWLERDG